MESARWSVWDLPAAIVPMNYIEQVQRAGAVAVLIPPDPALVDAPARALDVLDGLLLVGGVDVEAGVYGAAAHPSADPPLPLRDAVEIALVRAAIARDLPVLGICRGAQIINVASGGTLLQHLPDDLGHDDHRRILGHFDGNEHEVRVDAGSRALEATGAVAHRVASHHHQAIDVLGRGLRVSARAVGDDLPEAVESEGPGWVLGVQWHPEADPGSRVIGALVRAATARRGEVGVGKKGASSRPQSLTECERS